MRKRLLLIGCCLSLASCGGGSSGGGSVAVVPGGSSPTPTPSPTVTPTPAARAIDFADDMAFDSTIALSVAQFTYTDTLGRTNWGLLGDEWLPDGQVVLVRYAASPESMQFAYPGMTAIFTAADRYATTPYRRYSNSASEMAVGWFDSKSSAPLKYVTLVAHRTPDEPYISAGISGQRSTIRSAIVGYVSPRADYIPNSLSFAGTPLVLSTWAALGGNGQLWVRSGSNQVTGVIRLSAGENGVEVQKADLRLTGTLNDATNTFSGTLTDPTNGFTGTFRGALFGPGREEMGLMYRFSRPADGGATITGQLLGGRY